MESSDMPLDTFATQDIEKYSSHDESALDDSSDNETVRDGTTTHAMTRNTDRSGRGSFLSVRRGSGPAPAEHRKGSFTSNISLAITTSGLHTSSTNRRFNNSTNNGEGHVVNDPVTTLPALHKGESVISAWNQSREHQVMNAEAAPVYGNTMSELAFANNHHIIEVKDEPSTPANQPSTIEVKGEEDLRSTGKIASWRGGIILGTACFAQFLDDIWMSSITIAVPKVSEDFKLAQGAQSWPVSAYTLTFGGFLLLAGMLSDRFGRRMMFSGGMLWLAIVSIAAGVSQTGVQFIIFRALQGLGAAASVPSSIGVLSTYFVGHERHRALSLFGAAGALGYVVGLVMGGILSGSLGWRYTFYINAPLMFIVSIVGWFSFPAEVLSPGKKSSLDFLGAGLGTSGIILMTFALSQSQASGWNKPVVIVTLVLSVFVLLGFTWVERKTVNPIMPAYLWKLPSFAGIWCSGFLLYCWWASVAYYLSLVAQEVLLLSPLVTGLYLIPMGVVSFVTSLLMGVMVEKFQIKHLFILGFVVALVGTFPAAFVKVGDNFFTMVFPTSIISAIGATMIYNVASIALVSAVPPIAKSLAGGLINTAFQVGSGFGLAITSVVNESVLKRQLNPSDPTSIMRGYQAALFASCGLLGGSLLLSVFAVRNGQKTVSVVH